MTEKIHYDIQHIKVKSEQVLPREIRYPNQFVATRYVDGLTQPLSSTSLIDCLKTGESITPLDGILFLGCKRIARDISRLKKAKSQMNINMTRIEVLVHREKWQAMSSLGNVE